MPVLFWVVYPIAIWTACFGAWSDQESERT
jgi:hypothetical protein